MPKTDMHYASLYVHAQFLFHIRAGKEIINSNADHQASTWSAARHRRVQHESDQERVPLPKTTATTTTTTTTPTACLGHRMNRIIHFCALTGLTAHYQHCSSCMPPEAAATLQLWNSSKPMSKLM